MAATVRNTAIKRIQGDVREMMTNPSDQYAAAPLETNMFDWHFTLRGPRETEFEGGIYHGRIILPSDYPFKPPNIMLLTPNGRFEVKKKICLSISAFHPEEWQPAWGVRLILEALTSFMPTKGEGAIGALDFSADERKRLAKLSVNFKCESCGRVADLLPDLVSEEGSEKKPSKYADQIAQLHIHGLEKSASPASAASDEKKAATATTESSEHGLQEATATSVVAQSRGEVHNEALLNSMATLSEVKTSADEVSHVDNVDSSDTAAAVSATIEEPPEAQGPAVMESRQNADTAVTAPVAGQVRESDHVDTLLHYLTIAIVVALFALIYKKLLQTHGLLQSAA
uniref:UBC core domain-containing protein n=1 Tax=Peronospora matthiolae TaxID=2874970 RepID=A0AAV1VG77_9STRA